MIGRHLQSTYVIVLHRVEWFVEVWGAGREINEGEVACVTERSPHRLVTRMRAARHDLVRALAISETNLKRAGNTVGVKPVQLCSLTHIWRARERGSEQE